MSKILHFAVAIGGWSARHRIITALAVFAILVASVGGGIFTVRALAPGEEFGGDVAPGSHVWRYVGTYPFDYAEIETYFCARCHKDIVDEYGDDGDGDGVADPGSDHAGNVYCWDCHEKSDDGHVARIAKCGDCHYWPGPGDPPGAMWWVAAANELAADPHGSMLSDMGEDTDLSQASWTCKACHTQMSINVTVADEVGPLEFDISGSEIGP